MRPLRCDRNERNLQGRSDISAASSGLCTPTITRPLSAYFSYHVFKYGIVLMQLMQLYVQKSTSITFPLRSARVIGSELTKPAIFVSSGASLNCDLSICNLVIVPLSSIIAAGTKLFCWPEAALLSSGLLKYTPKPTISATTPRPTVSALRLSAFIVLLPS